MELQHPPGQFSPGGPLTAELPSWLQRPPAGPEFPLWPTVTQETTVAKAPTLLRRDCAPKTRKVSSWIFSDSDFVLSLLLLVTQLAFVRTGTNTGGKGQYFGDMHQVPGLQWPHSKVGP